jgi:hypothetical protein
MTLRRWLPCALLLLQGADVVLTWRLLTTRPDVGEANPLALAVLQQHGWAGAVALKLACTAVALGCVHLVRRRRPAFGGALLGGMCALMLAVVGYSAALLAWPGGDAAWLAQSRREAARLDEERACLDELMRARDGLCADLAAGRLALPEAVRRMTGHLHAASGRLTRAMRSSWPCPTRPDRVEAYLLRHCPGRRAGRLPRPGDLARLGTEVALSQVAPGAAALAAADRGRADFAPTKRHTPPPCRNEGA